MNTRKQVLIMSALLMMMLVTVGVYAAWYPYRATDAGEEFTEKTSERGSILFARNCRLCHGDVGEGGALGGRLPAAPALNRPDLQGFEDSKAKLASEVNLTATSVELDTAEGFAADDIILIDEERMKVTGVDENTLTVDRAYEHTDAAGHFPDAAIYAFDEAVLTETISLMTNTIVCGRVGTAMPAWAQSQGGPLSDEQIRQLTVLISTARWDLVAEEVDVEDVISAALTGPVAADATEISVTDVTRFTADEAIRLGDERLRLTAVPEFEAGATSIPGMLTVERGIYNTFAVDHTEETEIFRFPEVAEPAINAASCGQTAQAPVASGPCEVSDGKVLISAMNIAFDCSEIEVDSGGETVIAFTNLEATPHNVAVYASADDLTAVGDGAVGNIFGGPDVTQEITFQTPAAGEYFFRCDVHPAQMVGTLTVQ